MEDNSKKKWRESLQETRLEKYLSTPFDKLGIENRRRRVFEEQDYKCNRCGLDKWQGQLLILELEHKDGDNRNNERSNLEGLCPNCHSLTSTWRGRNKTERVKDQSLLIKNLKNGKTIRQALLDSGYTASARNYRTAERLRDMNNGVVDY